jgi:ketosteroid isomerase-like protein
MPIVVRVETGSAAEPQLSNEEREFQNFMRSRALAASSYVEGDAEPLRQMLAASGPATFFGPQGGYQQGAKIVAGTYAHDAESFAPGSESHFEILHMGTSGDLAYWVGLQHATVQLRGKPDVVPMDLRVTEVFHREGGEWKLVHRHADTLSSDSHIKGSRHPAPQDHRR